MVKLIEWRTYSDIVNDPEYKNELSDISGTAACSNVRLERMVIDCIIINKFKFSGEYHQYGENGTPVFEIDGKKFPYCASFRYWGGIMADAWNEIENTSEYNYMDFYMSPDKEFTVAPKTPKDFKSPLDSHEVESYALSLLNHLEVVKDFIDYDALERHFNDNLGITDEELANKMRELNAERIVALKKSIAQDIETVRKQLAERGFSDITR